VLANVVAVFVGHDHIGDHDVRLSALNFGKRLRRIMAGNHIDVFPAKGDLDHLAHGGAVIDEIDCGRGGAHRINPPSASASSASVWAASSSSRRASNISSVADRSTVRVPALSPGKNLYDPVSTPLQRFTTWTNA